MTPPLAGVATRRLAGGQGALMLEWGQCFSPSCWARLLHISSRLSLSFFLSLFISCMASAISLRYRLEARGAAAEQTWRNKQPRFSHVSQIFNIVPKLATLDLFTHTSRAEIRSGTSTRPIWLRTYDYFSQLQGEKKSFPLHKWSWQSRTDLQ